jgi:hypothetical protein
MTGNGKKTNGNPKNEEKSNKTKCTESENELTAIKATGRVK